MIIVTGGAGFIGSNLVKSLNVLGFEDILVVDDLGDGSKFSNIADSKISDYSDKDVFIEQMIRREKFLNEKDITAIFHQGACTDTTEWDGKYMMRNNYEYSKVLLHYCLEKGIPFIYASSAAVYGDGNVFREELAFEKPLNVYGYSKFLFDQYVRRLLPLASSQIVGLRYFNVYGQREQHKEKMASVAFHLNNQLLQQGRVELFEGCDGYVNGEQRRDFVYVEDVAKVNLWFWQNPGKSGIFNLGTGKSATFNEIAHAVIKWHGYGEIEYVPFPNKLRGCYQSFTEANIDRLRAAGYRDEFKNIAVGMKEYLDWLNKSKFAVL